MRYTMSRKLEFLFYCMVICVALIFFAIAVYIPQSPAVNQPLDQRNDGLLFEAAGWAVILILLAVGLLWMVFNHSRGIIEVIDIQSRQIFLYKKDGTQIALPSIVRLVQSGDSWLMIYTEEGHKYDILLYPFENRKSLLQDLVKVSGKKLEHMNV